MTTRAHISRTVELAAALLQIPDANGERAIPHEHAKLMTADQIISLFHRDHDPIPKAQGGPDQPWNITWRFIGPHRIKTATIDIPAIAHSKRVVRSQQEHDARMAAKLYGEPVPTKRKHPIRSAGFRKDITKGFDGCVRSRKIGRKG